MTEADTSVTIAARGIDGWIVFMMVENFVVICNEMVLLLLLLLLLLLSSTSLMLDVRCSRAIFVADSATST